LTPRIASSHAQTVSATKKTARAASWTVPSAAIQLTTAASIATISGGFGNWATVTPRTFRDG
jgi:hypothetical protein